VTGRYARVPERAIGDERLGENDLRLLLALGLHANDNGEAWPCRRRLGEITKTGIIKSGRNKGKVDLRNTASALGRLDGFGYLRRIGRVGKNIKYRILFDDAAPCGNGVPPHADGTDERRTTTRHDQRIDIRPDGVSPYALTTQEQPNGTTHSQREIGSAQGALLLPIDGSGSVERSFSEFWEAFPAQRRSARAETLARYRAIVSGGEAAADTLLAAAAQYSGSREVAEGYACAPERWLREERWKRPFGPPATAGTERRSAPTGGGRIIAGSPEAKRVYDVP
jgi:hypothetical protein